MPMIDVIDHPANAAGGLIVVEVAAFMLETCTSFRPHVGMLTNVTEDHLDRFGTMERYAEIKARIWEWQHPGDLAIANASDPWVMRGTAGLSSDLYTFDSHGPLAQIHGAEKGTRSRGADQRIHAVPLGDARADQARGSSRVVGLVHADPVENSGRALPTLSLSTWRTGSSSWLAPTPGAERASRPT
jgi:UDP-N-acetylmuramoylalanine-D-glutamate ligase